MIETVASWTVWIGGILVALVVFGYMLTEDGLQTPAPSFADWTIALLSLANTLIPIMSIEKDYRVASVWAISFLVVMSVIGAKERRRTGT